MKENNLCSVFSFSHYFALLQVFRVLTEVGPISVFSCMKFSLDPLGNYTRFVPVRTPKGIVIIK